ncbi:MAG: M20/M25/M40 family metallo-hydrolase [Chloroflexia bacterium]|nr:M20/M25/M40 family metallo-hydrolase [Chloroflexia bacterium]
MVNRERVLYTFLELVQTDHPSGGEALLAQRIASRLRSLGLEARIDPAGNVIAFLDGQGEPILLSAHLDSVDPCKGVVPVVKDGVVRSDGSTVLGADDISGVTAIVEALQVVAEGKIEHRPVEVVLTVEEETGLHGSKKLDFSALKSRMGMVLDGGGPFGAIIMRAPSHDQISATILGKASHAGVAPEEGINAIVIAAEAIAKMPLGRVDKDTTANVGIIKGGTATNIVPDRVQLEAECRSMDERKLRRQTKAIAEALEKAAKAHGAQAKIQVSRAYNGFTLTEDDDIIKLAIRAVEAVGVPPHLESSGGGSDANIFNAHGVSCTNLSTGMMAAHTTEEWILVEDLIRTAQATLELIRLDHGQDA